MTKQQILEQFGGDEPSFYQQFPTEGDWNKYCMGGLVKKKKFNFGGTVNVLDARQGAIDSTKQGINRAASIYGTVAGEVANVVAMVATAGASGAAGAAGASGAEAATTASNTAQMVNSVQNGGAGSLAEANSMNASNAINTAKTVNNAQTGGNLKTNSIGNTIANKDVGGIGGMVKKTVELQGQIGAELFGKGISDTQNRDVYAGLNQTNQAKEKYLGIENTADVYGQRPGSMMAEYGMTVPYGGNLHGPSHEQGGVPILAEGGEAVMTQEAVKKFAPILSAINQSVGGNPITPGQSTSYAENGTYVGNGHPIVGNPIVDDEYGPENMEMYKKDNGMWSYRQNPDNLPKLRDNDGNEISQQDFDAMSVNQNSLAKVATSMWRAGLTNPNAPSSSNRGGIPLLSAQNPSIPNYSMFPGSPNYSPNYPPNPNEHDPDGFLWKDKEEPIDTNTTQRELRPRYGEEALAIAPNVVSLLHNAFMKYHAGPKPIPMTAEEERTNRFVERNTDLSNIATTDAMANASNKTSSSSGKLAAQLGVYSNSINKKMDSEAKWYGEEEAAKNRNIAQRNNVNNSNRTELNNYNQNEAVNKANFRQGKADAVSAEAQNITNKIKGYGDIRSKNADQLLNLHAYSKALKIQAASELWKSSPEIQVANRDYMKYLTEQSDINDMSDINTLLNSNILRSYTRNVKTKKKDANYK